MWKPKTSAGLLRVAAWLVPVTLSSAAARADVQHVVARGHTIDAIAHRYHVTVKAIVDANHLRDPRHLKIGETLTIPGVSAVRGPGAAGGTGLAGGKGIAGKGAGHPPSYAMRAKTPGVIHATRLATNEDFVVRVSSRRGHVAPTAEKSFERLMRSAGGLTHPPDPRLVSLVGQVSNHFGSRRLEVISGFRPYSPTQYTAHSNHNIGHALDFRVVGVPNEVLRDYCKTLKNVGVGYYPNSTFVHLDVRDASTTWVDFSRPGEPPRYSTPGVEADEGTSDVAEQPVTPESATPGEVNLTPPSDHLTIPPAGVTAPPPDASSPSTSPPASPPPAPTAPLAPPPALPTPPVTTTAPPAPPVAPVGAPASIPGAPRVTRTAPP